MNNVREWYGRSNKQQRGILEFKNIIEIRSLPAEQIQLKREKINWKINIKGNCECNTETV